MTDAKQRITLDDPMELLILPVDEDQPEADDDEEGQRP